MDRITLALRRPLRKRAFGVAFPLVLLATVCAGLAAHVFPRSDTALAYARASWFADFLPESWSDRADLRSQPQNRALTANRAPAPANKVLPQRATTTPGFPAEVASARSDIVWPSDRPAWANSYTTASIPSLIQSTTPDFGVGTKTSA